MPKNKSPAKKSAASSGMRISPQGEICMGALIVATYYWSMYSTYLTRSQYGMKLSYYHGTVWYGTNNVIVRLSHISYIVSSIAALCERLPNESVWPKAMAQG